MAVGTVPETGGSKRRPLFAVLSLASGLIGLAGVTMLGLTSFLAGFNPPDWLRILSMAPIPFAVIASVALGVAGLRGPRRGVALAGLILAALSVIAFIVMIAQGG